MKSSLAIALDSELLRVASQEDVPMEFLVNECAELIGKTSRMVHNYRSGKWDLPASLIPILCERFKSRALLDALTEEVRRTPIEIPEGSEFTQLSVQILKQICDHHYKLIDAYKSETSLDRSVLNHLEEQVERVIQNERLLFTLLEAEYEQRIAIRRKQA